MPFVAPMLAEAGVSNVVATALANVDLTGVLGELLGTLGIVLPVMISFIGIRKALSFVTGQLRRA